MISIVADLQDPPEMIRDFIAKWEEGYMIVLGVKTRADETALDVLDPQALYYRLVDRLSEIRDLENFTGFGLYDRKVMDAVRRSTTPTPTSAA